MANGYGLPTRRRSSGVRRAAGGGVHHHVHYHAHVHHHRDVHVHHHRDVHVHSHLHAGGNGTHSALPWGHSRAVGNGNGGRRRAVGSSRRRGASTASATRSPSWPSFARGFPTDLGF